jgi:K+/H+ antiporter YhaU regulatory subunit KhtT
MLLLSNHQVVDVKERSGIYVSSMSHAKDYIKHFEHHRSNKNIVLETKNLLEQSFKINQQLEKKFKQMVHTYEKDVFPFQYFTCDISEDSKYIGKTLDALNFYEQTGGLIFAIEEDGILTQVPSPKTMINAGMTLYILGDKDVKSKTSELIK